MAGGAIQLLVGDVRGVDVLVTAAPFGVEDVLLEQAPDGGSPGEPEWQPLADLLVDEEQTQLPTQLLVIALAGQLEAHEVAVKLLGAVPGGAVDPLQHLVALVAPPVRPRHPCQLEMLDLTGVLDVRTPAEVEEIPRPVETDLLLRGGLALGQDLDLVGLAQPLENLHRGGLLKGLLDVLRAPGGDLAHAFFDRGQLLLFDRLSAQVEVVVEAVFDGRPDGVSGAGVELADRGRQQVRGGVPEHVELHRCGGDAALRHG